jgi:hypothetical protein
MPRNRPALVRARPAVQPAERAELRRVTCDRCGSEQWALPSGEARPHMRSTRPDEGGYDARVPTMTTCDDYPEAKLREVSLMPANPRVSIDDIEIWLETDSDGTPVLAFPSLAVAAGRLKVLSGEAAGDWDFGRVQGVR